MRRLKPWQRARIVREFHAERDRRVAALAYAGARFRIGQRVHVVGGWRHANVTEIVAGKRFRYRLQGSPFLYHEADLEEATRTP